MTERKDIILGLAIFILNFIMAVSQNWTAKDLVWSLWISSLILGYAYILTTIMGFFIRGDREALLGGSRNASKVKTPVPVLNVFFLFALLFMTGFSKYTFLFFILVVLSILFSLDRDHKSRIRLPFLPDPDNFLSKLIINLPAVLFILGFFSFHFIFFHFVHSIFLNGFFPLIKEAPFGKTIEETVFYFFDLIKISFNRYWMFIGLSAVSRLTLYAKAFKGGGMNSMIIPYKNVVRMHITIFAVAFMSMAHVQNYALYLIFIIYFLPIRKLYRLLFPAKKSVDVQQPHMNKPIE
jgi:hypothetical protein